MERVLFYKTVTPADLREHYKWARRVGAFYCILLLGGISFIVGHHYQSAGHAKVAATPVVAINHFQR